MKDSSFYEGRPYAKAQGKKTVEDFAKLQGTELEIGMSWGVEALMEEQISSGILILLALGICIVLVSQVLEYKFVRKTDECIDGEYLLSICSGNWLYSRQCSFGKTNSRKAKSRIRTTSKVD